MASKNPNRKPARCQCGCGEQTLGGKFRPGHDARLKGRLLREARGRDKRTAAKARAELKRRGWSHFLEKAA